MKNLQLLLIAVLVTGFSVLNAQPGPGAPCGIQQEQFSYSFVPNSNGAIDFTDSSAVAQGWMIDYWIWNFDDGSAGIGQHVTHTYLQGGTYNVCLIIVATNNDGGYCSDTLCELINVPNTPPPPPNCQAYFTYQLTQTFGQVQFTSNCFTADSVVGFLWSFGDGSSADNNNPSHTYATGATYNVCLSILTSRGCTSSYCDSVTVPNSNPCAGFTTDWSYTVAGNGIIQFTAADTGTGATHHDWNFGDGSYGFGTNPSHAYAASGIYHVCQYVYIEANGGVPCNDSSCRDIVVTDTINCNGFAVSITDILDPQPPGQILSAHVTGGNNTNITYKWSTGSDDASISISQGGYYCVTATTGNCTAAACDSVHIAPPTCTANFTYQPTSEFGAIQFTNTSTAPDSIISYSWYFGDNTSSTDKNPLHVYGSGGAYLVCLRIETNVGCVDYHCDTVVISNGGNPCTGLTANWTYTSGTNGSVQFTAADTGTGATHHDWNFGDGSAEGFGPNPSHTYTASGYYRVCQYVYVESPNAVVCVDSFCQYIEVTVPNNCNGFAVSISDIIEPNDPAQTLVAVVAGSTATGTKYKWSNDETSSSIQVTVSGYYCVTATNANNCTASSCDTVVITGANPCNGLTAKWTYTASPNGSVHFVPSDSAGGDTHHIWSFGDNTSSTDVSPTHTYTTSGTYHVCLYVYITGQTCVDSLCQDIQVNAGNPCDGIQAGFTYTVTGQTIYVKSQGVSSTTAQYQWSLDGHKSSIGDYVDYSFTGVSYGQHRVCLYVYAGGNTTPCDSLCNSITVSNPCNGLTASWTATVLQNGALHFEPADTAQSVEHAWSFGDGTTSGNVDPVHSYAVSGTYRVCLYIYIPGTTCVDSSCQDIQVTVSSSCAGFSAYIEDIPDSTGTGHTLIAHAYSPNANPVAPTFAWSTNQTGSSIHVSQTGVYCVTATDANCTAVACDSVHSHPGSCVAYFSYTPTNTLNGFAFTDLSVTSDPVIAWDWTFGDGDSSSAHNPTHNYANTGTYDVCLTITTASGCTATRCDTLRIKPCTGLSADWASSNLNNGGVQFNGVTSSTVINNLWIFGDGTTSTNPAPIHYYSQSGLYDVCHIVYIPGSVCVDTSCHSIQAGSSASCHAGFTYITPVVSGTTIYFTNASTSNDSIISWYWTFGDGDSSHDKNPVHTYNGAGNRYEVCLTIATVGGCSSTYCDSIKVGGSLSNCSAFFKWNAINCLTVEFENTSAPGYTSQSWSFGDGSTDTLANLHHTYIQPGNYTVILNVYYGNTCTASDTQQVTLPACGTNDTICGIVFGDVNNNGIGDSSETVIPGVQVNVGNISAFTDSNGAYLLIVPPGVYYVSIVTPEGCIPTLPLNNYGGTVVNAYYINGKAGGTYCGYNFGINCNIVHICGTVFFDANNNGIQDSTEAGIPNVHLLIVDSNGTVHNAYTNQYGDYCETLPAGLYTITVATNYPPGAVSPAYIPVDATTGGVVYGNNNFAVYIPAGECDLSVNLTPRSCVSPGFPALYSIEVCNDGTNSTGGTVNMYYDESLTFDSAYPAPVSQNSSTFTVSWPVNSLTPGQCAYYWVAFRAATSLTIGQPVLDIATVNTTACTDINLANNVDTVTQIVKGSWDPNNKQVNPAGEGSEGLINNSEELTYSINFQNTGTAPAVNVIVQDAIPTFLDMTTFRMVSSNPPFTSMQFNGNQVTWKFSDVLLPDSAADETNSHGYVSFAATPVAGLPQGTQIMNAGNVFFDYNAGVTTQNTLNTIDYALAVKDLPDNNITITLQPNPFSDYTIVKIDGAVASYELRVYDMLGNLVNDQFTENNIFRIERGSMAAGMYMYQVVQQDKVIGMGKMIAQ